MSDLLAELAPVEPVLETWHGLRPIPKGSLYHVGNGVLREDNVRSKPHKDAMILHLRTIVARHPRRAEFPLRCPVAVRLAFFFVTPAGLDPATDRPSTAGGPNAVGDTDKLCRLVLDALTQAEVIEDDDLVVDLAASAWYDRAAGTRITVAPAQANDGRRLEHGWPVQPPRTTGARRDRDRRAPAAGRAGAGSAQGRRGGGVRAQPRP